jgi:hypothetical protein
MCNLNGSFFTILFVGKITFNILYFSFSFGNSTKVVISCPENFWFLLPPPIYLKASLYLCNPTLIGFSIGVNFLTNTSGSVEPVSLNNSILSFVI